MFDILENLNEIGDGDFEKCGEIILASKQNVYAFCCVHCHDIFVKIQEFIQHLHKTHKDVIHFEDEGIEESYRTAEVNTYTVEELLNNNGRESLNDAESLWNNAESSSATEKDQLHQENKLIKNYEVSLDFEDILDEGKSEEESVNANMWQESTTTTVDGNLSPSLLKQLKNNEDLNSINVWNSTSNNEEDNEKITYTILNETSAKINVKPIVEHTLNAIIMQESDILGDGAVYEIVLNVNKEEVSDEESEAGVEEATKISAVFEQNEIYIENLSGDKESVQCENTSSNLTETENAGDEREMNFLQYIENILINEEATPAIQVLKRTREPPELATSISHENMQTKKTKIAREYDEITKVTPKENTVHNKSNTNEEYIFFELISEPSAAKRSRPNADKTITHVTLLDAAVADSDKLDSINAIAHNETNTKEAATVQNIEMQIINETPIKRLLYLEQSFAENEIKERKQQPHNIKPHSKIVQTLFIPRPRKASIDVLQHTTNDLSRKTPLRRSNNTLDYKNYAPNRSTRKVEVLERMRSIKKQIFKSIDKKNTTKDNIDKHNTEMKSIMEMTDYENFPSKQPKVQITNIEALPLMKFDTKLKQLTPSVAEKTNNLHLHAKKNHIIDTATPIANNLNISFQRPAIELPSCSKTVKSKKQTVEIIKEERFTSIMPIETATKAEINTPLKYILRQSTRVTRNTQNNRQTKTETNTLTTSSISTAMPLLRPSLNKAVQQNCQNENLTPLESSENPSFILSNNGDNGNISMNDSATESKLISFESNTFGDLSTQNIEEHKNPTEDEGISKAVNTEVQNDLDLLEKIGLQIIKIPTLEDDLPVEEIELIHAKAKKFANLFIKCNYIWQVRRKEPNEKKKEKFNSSFELLTQEFNSTFNEKFTIKDCKRIVNLLSIWYVTAGSAKVLKKKIPAEPMEFYMHLFSFLPKTMRLFYFCEYCDKEFHAESKYIIHRIEHTGEVPFICKYCNRGFKIEHSLKAHELLCKNLLRCKDCKKQFNNEEKFEKHQCKICKICNKQFPTLTDLAQHRRAHEKSGLEPDELDGHNEAMQKTRVFKKCHKCSLGFDAEVDFKLHKCKADDVEIEKKEPQVKFKQQTIRRKILPRQTKMKHI